MKGATAIPASCCEAERRLRRRLEEIAADEIPSSERSAFITAPGRFSWRGSHRPTVQYCGVRRARRIGTVHAAPGRVVESRIVEAAFAAACPSRRFFRRLATQVNDLRPLAARIPSERSRALGAIAVHRGELWQVQGRKVRTRDTPLCRGRTCGTARQRASRGVGFIHPGQI